MVFIDAVERRCDAKTNRSRIAFSPELTAILHTYERVAPGALGRWGVWRVIVPRGDGGHRHRVTVGSSANILKNKRSDGGDSGDGVPGPFAIGRPAGALHPVFGAEASLLLISNITVTTVTTVTRPVNPGFPT